MESDSFDVVMARRSSTVFSIRGEQGLDWSQLCAGGKRSRLQRCPLLGSHSEHPPDPARCIWHHWIDQRGNHAERVSGVIQRPIEFIRFR